MTHPVGWYLPLPGPPGELAAVPGGCAVAGAGYVAVVLGTGELLWSVPTEPGLRRGLAVLPDGRVADVEGDHVVVRRAGGELAARWDGRGVTALAAAPDGDLVYVQWSRDTGASLVKTGADGARRGVVPLAVRGFHPPLVTHDLIVVAEGSRVRALDHAGRTRWTATRHQLSRGEPPDLPPGTAREPVVALADGRFVVEFAEDVGYALHVVDPHTGTVTRLPTAARSPVVVADGRLAARGGDRVVSFAPDGTTHWTYPAPPDTLLADAAGRVVVVTAPDRDRRGRDEPHTVHCVAPDGTPAWTWQPPGPLTATPTTSGGVLYAAADGGVFALSL
jgi:outer membrane protein assembly factor BamB